MSEKAKTGIAVLLVVLAGFPLACKPSQENSGQAATETDAPVPAQTPEQKVLDQFLGNWNCETTEFKSRWTPEEKHNTATYSVTRILGGKFNQQVGEDAEKNASLVLYTYDSKLECYSFWHFGSNYGGPDAPRNYKWIEATRTMELNDPGDNGQTTTSQMHFTDDDTILMNLIIRDSTGETLYHAEYKMTRARAHS